MYLKKYNRGGGNGPLEICYFSVIFFSFIVSEH